MIDEVKYVRGADGTHVAYRVIGEPGGVDLVVVAGAFFSLELLAEDRVTSRFLTGLAAIGRVVVFDKRGVGSSDPMSDWDRSAQEQWAEDLMAVVDGAGLTDPVVISWETMGVARLAVSRHGEAFSKMVLINPTPSPGKLIEAYVGSGANSFQPRSVEEMAFPSRINDPDFQAWLVRAGRVGASPSLAPRMWDHLLGYSKPLTPPGISTPTLVLHNVDSMVLLEWASEVAADLDEAELVSVPGADAYPISGDIDPLIREIARFLGRETSLTPERTVRAVLFTDLVDSTARASAEGDTAWRAILEHHDQLVTRAISHRGGNVVKFTGDGVLCLMPSASAALDAASDLRSSLAETGLIIRCGIHVGDVDEREGDISGIAVNVASRVMALAPNGETLLTTSAAESAIGSGHHLEVFGTFELKGIDGQ